MVSVLICGARATWRRHFMPVSSESTARQLIPMRLLLSDISPRPTSGWTGQYGIHFSVVLPLSTSVWKSSTLDQCGRAGSTSRGPSIVHISVKTVHVGVDLLFPHRRTVVESRALQCPRGLTSVSVHVCFSNLLECQFLEIALPGRMKVVVKHTRNVFSHLR